MKKKLIVILLLIAVIVGAASQIYAISSEKEKPNIPVDPYITVREVRYFLTPDFPEQIFVRRSGYMGYIYEGYIPYISYSISSGGRCRVIYEGDIYVTTDH